MLQTESQWSEALATNNIRAIIRWLQKLTDEGEGEAEEILQTFSCWVQRASEFAKKELLTLCFSRCRGLWMFLDRSSFTRVHLLLQRLRNLLTLAHWARRQLTSAHFWHGVGVPCVVCRDTCGSSDVRRGCWTRELRTLKQHIWLGRLVEWWGIMGLLPKYPEAHEVKRITQMWKGMDHSYQKACLETPGHEEGEKKQFQSLIQGLVSQLDRHHGCIWISEDCTDVCYPPPSLQALLRLVLVPQVNNMSVQTLLMYFVMDMANFLQCKDDLLQSFCHAFTIPSSFSQQIRAFWMLDHGHIKASMELLLSPRAAVPVLPWQHRCILRRLLTRKQPQLALSYLHWATPAVQSIEDAKLCAGVLLQNSCVSDAWALLKRGHTESDDMVLHFLQSCKEFGLCTEASKFIPAGYNDDGDKAEESTEAPQIRKTERPPCPLSADLYQAQRVNTVSSEDFLQLVQKAAMEVRKPHPKISEVLWPEHTERKLNRDDMFLSSHALRQLTPSPTLMDILETEEHTDDPEEEKLIYNHPPASPGYTCFSLDLNCDSVSSFTSASSLPRLRLDPAYVYKSTLTMQRISSLLTDGGNQSGEEEDEDRDSPSSMEALMDCPGEVLPLDGARDIIFTSTSLDEELSAEGDFSNKAFLRMDDASLNETFLVTESDIDRKSSPHVESHSFSTPDVEASAGTPKDEAQSGCIPQEILSFCKADVSDSLPQEEPCEKTHDHQPDETAECLSRGSPCPVCETTQDLPPHPLQSRLPDDPVNKSSAGRRQLELSQQVTVCDVQSTSAASKTSSESSPQVSVKTDKAFLQSLWEEDVETAGASAGLLPATEQGPAITSENQTSSTAQRLPMSFSLLNFMDFTAEQIGDKKNIKQADKEEPAGWSSTSGWDSQGAIRSGRTWTRKGKRVKRA